MDTEFFVHLLSTASADHYKNNSLTHFKNHLSAPINLEDGFEVALVEVGYTYTPSLIKQGDKICDVEELDDDNIVVSSNFLINDVSFSEPLTNTLYTNSSPIGVSISKEKWEYALRKKYFVKDIIVPPSSGLKTTLLLDGELVKINSNQNCVGVAEIVDELDRHLLKLDIDISLLYNKVVFTFNKPYLIQSLDFCDALVSLFNLNTKTVKRDNESVQWFATVDTTKTYKILDGEELCKVSFVRRVHYPENSDTEKNFLVNKIEWESAKNNALMLKDVKPNETTNEVVRLYKKQTNVFSNEAIDDREGIVDYISSELEKNFIDISSLEKELIITLNKPFLIDNIFCYRK